MVRRLSAVLAASLVMAAGLAGVGVALSPAASASEAVAAGNPCTGPATAKTPITACPDTASRLAAGSPPSKLTLLANDYDPPGQPPAVIVAVSVPAGAGTATIDTGGTTVIYTPPAPSYALLQVQRAHRTPTVTFTYTISNGFMLHPKSVPKTSTATVTVPLAEPEVRPPLLVLQPLSQPFSGEAEVLLGALNTRDVYQLAASYTVFLRSVGAATPISLAIPLAVAGNGQSTTRIVDLQPCVYDAFALASDGVRSTTVTVTVAGGDRCSAGAPSAARAAGAGGVGGGISGGLRPGGQPATPGSTPDVGGSTASGSAGRGTHVGTVEGGAGSTSAAATAVALANAARDDSLTTGGMPVSETLFLGAVALVVAAGLAWGALEIAVRRRPGPTGRA